MFDKTIDSIDKFFVIEITVIMERVLPFSFDSLNPFWERNRNITLGEYLMSCFIKIILHLLRDLQR